jgi:hypothetical protein
MDPVFEGWHLKSCPIKQPQEAFKNLHKVLIQLELETS